MHMLNKLIVVFFFTCFAVIPAFAQSVDELLHEAAELMEAHNQEGALDLYLQVLEDNPEHYDALWNASLLHSTIGFRFEDENRQVEYYVRAQKLAEKAMELHGDSGHPYYVMAVAKGRMADHVGVNRRIELGHIIGELAKKAVELMPDHAPSWHLYGVWQSEVANVSRAERVAARFISGGLPDGTNEFAEEYLMKAKSLDGKSIIIRLDLARHFMRSGHDDRAIPVLEELLELEPRLIDDPDFLEEAKEYLRDLRG
ncbi:MAG: hypothetical protein EA391_08075 [Balneolaceae bacterium]|nr:MAG: hypothetical protein EA391_08075 [Balneolaceae bacterium]